MYKFNIKIFRGNILLFQFIVSFAKIRNYLNESSSLSNFKYLNSMQNKKNNFSVNKIDFISSLMSHKCAGAQAPEHRISGPNVADVKMRRLTSACFSYEE